MKAFIIGLALGAAAVAVTMLFSYFGGSAL